MGRNPYSLKHEAQIVSLLIFKFPESVKSDFATRNAGKPSGSSNIPLLNMLSPDFASFTSRMDESATKAVAKRLVEFERETNSAKEKLTNAENTMRNAENKFSRSQLWVPASVSLIVAILTILGANLIDIFGVASKKDLDSLSSRVTAIETVRDVEAIRLELQGLKESLAPLLKSQTSKEQ
jgi:sulfite reductase alpha subunit-like flavoprotein